MRDMDKTHNKIEGYQGKNVLITGGLGFIGSNIAEELISLGAEVFVIDNLDPRCGGNEFNAHFIIDNPRFHLYKSGMDDEKLMKELLPGIDFVFNMVGHVCHINSIKDPYKDIEVNLAGHIAFLELCRKYNPRLKIGYASTRGVYGKTKNNPVDESASISPVDFNGINKHISEQYHLLYSKIYGIKSFVIRLTNTYGPKMRIKDSRQGFICLFIKQSINNETINIFGDVKQLRDFNYISDVVNAFLLCMINNDSDGCFFNIGSEKSLSVLDCATLLSEKAGSGKIVFKEFPDEHKKIEIGDYTADYSKIRNIIKWEPTVSFDEGITRTVDYYKKYGEKYV